MFGAHRNGYHSILLVVALYCVVAVSITGNALFFLYDDRPTSFFIVTWLLPIILWYAVVTVRLLIARRPEPLRRLVRYTRLNRAWIMRSLLLILVMAVWASAFTVLKMNIPEWVPFYADPALIRLDRMLLGTDAWRLTHAVIGPAGTLFLDRVYALWFVVLVGFLGWTVGTRNAAFQVQSLLSFVLIWFVLGVAMATTFSSVGPCFLERFFGRDDFAPLMAELRGNPAGLLALDAMDYLEEMYGKTAYANGISAMPSLHVAMAAWFVLVAREGSRRLLPMVFAVVYAILILVGSVHLGWHYAVDGVVSIIVTPAIWRLARLFLAAAAIDRSPAKGGVPACAN